MSDRPVRFEIHGAPLAFSVSDARALVAKLQVQIDAHDPSPAPPPCPCYRVSSPSSDLMYPPEAMRAAFESGRAEGARNEERKRAWVADDYRKLQEELAAAKAKLFAVKADKADVWFWDRTGDNDLDTLTCPIVMWPETLIEIREMAAAEARAACVAKPTEDP